MAIKKNKELILDEKNRKKSKYIIANWKMNGSQELAKEFNEYFSQNKSKVIICPPSSLIGYFDTDKVKIGIQNISERTEASGAYTGEISATIALDSGCKYAMIGHSERRLYNHETDKTVFIKLQNCVNAGLTPILCIGESLDDYKAKNTLAVLSKQLKLALSINFKKLIIAYEPIWSIGTGLVPKLEDISSVAEFIHKLMKNSVEKNLILLYGGSVNKNNAKEILQEWPVDGVLVGGASLDLEHFKEIL